MGVHQKWLVYSGKSYWGTPILGNLHMYLLVIKKGNGKKMK